MKKLLITFCFLSLFNSFAGEFSKIDLVVREAIDNFYTIGREGERVATIESVTNMKIIATNTGDCFLEVFANTQVSGGYESGFYKTWVCVNKSSYGYEAEVIDSDLE